MVEGEDGWPIVHNVGDIVVQKGFVLGPRTIPDYELVYFPTGTMTVYELEGRPIRLDTPCFVFTRPGESHLYRFDTEKNVRHLFVHFEYSSLRQAAPRFIPLLRDINMLPVGSNSLVPGMVKQMLRIANNQPPHWKRRLTVLLAAALEELCASSDDGCEETANPLPMQIAEAIAYIEEHLSEPLTIESIAGVSGWSHEHFTRKFVSAVGMSPKRALLERRLQRAEQLMMMSGKWTIKQISYGVGFRDEHHFSKMYKRIRGITASDYIERCKDPLFRHMAAVVDPETPYPVNRHILVNNYIK
jgi:AraC family transcriptional regulator